MKKKLLPLALLPMLLCSCGNIFDGYLNRKFKSEGGGYLLFGEGALYVHWSRQMHAISWVKENVYLLEDNKEASEELGEDFAYNKKYLSVYWIPPKATSNALEFCGFFINKNTFFSLAFNDGEHGTRFQVEQSS